MFACRTLVVDNQCQPLQVLSWQRAICLTLSDRALALAHYDESVSTISRKFPVPSVVQMVNQLPRGKHRARFTRPNVLTRDQNTCQYCATKTPASALTMDHVIPRVNGGKTTWTNIVAACGTCNRRKGGRTPEEAGMQLLRKPIHPMWSAIVAMRGFLCQNPHPSWNAFLQR